MLSRRNMMKRAAGLSAFAVVNAGTTSFMDGERAGPDDLQAAEDAGDFTVLDPHTLGTSPQRPWEFLEAEIAELLRYYADVQLRPSGRALGFAVPLAAEALEVYVRLTKRQLDAREPKIPYLHADMLCGVNGGRFARVLKRLILTLDPFFKDPKFSLHLTDKAAVALAASKNTKTTEWRPHRVVTPRFIIDMDEPSFSPRTTAVFLLDSAMGVLQGHENYLKALNSSSYTALKVPKSALVGMPECEARRDGFLISFMTWSLGLLQERI